MTQSPEYHGLEVDGSIFRREEGPFAELFEELRKERFKDFASLPEPSKPPKRREILPDGLRTPAEAARKLRCSVKTLNAHVAAGDVGYVIIGSGKKRPRRMFTDADLDAFITNQTRKDVPCPSTRARARRSGNLISSGEVIAFTAQPRPRPGGKQKR
jgi:hypothetical protein